MRILFIQLFCLIIFNDTYSQNNSNQDSILSPNRIQRTPFNNDSININTVSYNTRIDGFYFDSAQRILLTISDFSKVTEYESNNLIVSTINLDSNKLIWTKEIDLRRNNFFIDSAGMFFQEGKKLYKVDIKTFEKKWEIPNKFYASFIDLNIGLVYSENFWNKKNGLFGIDLSNGKVIWYNDKIKLRGGFNYKSIRNDSHFVFINDKLYGLNIKTGIHWELERDLLTVVTYGNYKFTVAATSNFYLDSQFIYFATKTHFMKIDYEGRIYIDEKLKFEASRSKLFKRNNFFYLINKESQFFNALYPFVMKLDTNGKELNTRIFNDNQSIINYAIDSNFIFLLHNRLISKIDLDSLNIIENKEFKRKESKKWLDIIDVKLYIKKDSFNFDTLSPLNNNFIYVYKEDKDVSQFNNQFNFIKDFTKDNIFYPVYRDKQITIIKNTIKSESVILNKNNEILLVLNNITQIENKSTTYIISENQNVHFINKSELLK